MLQDEAGASSYVIARIRTGMASPPFDSVADAKTRPRYMARASMVAPFAAVAVMWIARQLEREQSESVVSAINLIASSVSTTLIVAGIGLGVAAIVGGRRLGSRDTVIIGAMGLFLIGGFLLLSAWAFYFLRTAS